MSNYYFSAIVSTGESIFGGTSLYFDGNSYIYTQGNKEFEFGTNNFNVEMWLRPDPYNPSMSTNNSYGILATTAAPVNFVGFLLGINPDYTLTCSAGNGGASWQHTITTPTSLSPNGWSHVALTRENDVLGLYINGDLKTFKNISGAYLNNPNNQIQIGGRSLNNQYYKGYIDELRITTGISRYSTFNRNYEFYTNLDPFYENTTLLLEYNNNQVSDISPINNQCLISGDAFISDLQEFHGKPSLILGQQTGYVIINSGNQSFNFGTGNFTIESWIHPINSDNLDYIPIIETRNTESSTSSFILGISKVANSNVLDFSPNGGLDKLYSNSPIQFNAWSFITLTRNNGTVNIYLNGIKQANILTTNADLTCENESPIIGLSKNGKHFHGYINDFRVTKSCRYSDSFDYPSVFLFKENAIDPYYKNTSILLRMGMNAPGENKILTDESKNNFSVSGYGNFRIVQSGYKFGNGYLEFNTGFAGSNISGGFISIPNSEVFNFENKDFTIEFWYKRKSGVIDGTDNAASCCPGWYGRFFTTYCSGGGFDDPKNAMINRGGLNILMEKNSTTGSVYFRNDGNSNFISGNLNIGEIPEEWTYYTLMRKSDTIASFKNGQITDSINVGNKSILNNVSGERSSPTINIGGTAEGYHSLNGLMDSFRITKGYARYLSMFTGQNIVQRNDFTTLSNLKEYYDYEIINLNDNYENIAKSLSISQNGAGSFNGSGYLEIIDNSNFNFGTGDFTIEFWFKNLTSGNSGVIFETSTGHSFPLARIFLTGNNKIYSNFSFSGNASDISLDMGTANSGEWGHYAIVRNTGSFFSYKNGINIDTKINQKTEFNNNILGNANIGGTGIYSIHGLLDEFRITKNLARYKSQFFPKKQIETSPNEDKYYYDNAVVIPFSDNYEKIIKDISSKKLTVINNNVNLVGELVGKKIQKQFGELSNGLLSYWSLDEINGTRFNFINSGPNLTDRNNNVGSSEFGKLQRAAKFDGLNTQTLLTPIFFPIGNTQSFTLSFWVNYPAFISPGSRTITFNPAASSSKEWGIVQNGTSLFIFNNYGVSTAAMSTTDPAKALTPGVWNHVVITKEGNRWEYYKNGQLQLSNPNYSWFSENNAAIFIGQNIYGFVNDGKPNGLIDEVGIWNRKLSNEEINILYGGGNSIVANNSFSVYFKNNENFLINNQDDASIECWINNNKINNDQVILSQSVKDNTENGYILKFGSNIANNSLPEIIGTFIDSASVNSNSRTLNVPTHSEGDLLIAVIMWRDNLDKIRMPDGWKLYGYYLNEMSGADTFSSQRLYVYTKIANSSEPSSYTWTTPASGRAHAGFMVSVRNGAINNVRESYGNGSTSTITTINGRLNLTAFTWIYSFSTPATYSQSLAGGGTITQISDSPKAQSRIGGAYSSAGGTVTSTIQATTTTFNPNHCGICIEIVQATSLDFYAFSESSEVPILKSNNIIAQNEWYHCAIVKDNDSSRLYINGLEESKSYVNNWSSINTGNLCIGFDSWHLEGEKVTGSLFDGIINNFKFTKKSKYKNNFNISRPINEKFEQDFINVDKFYDKTLLSLNGNTFNNDYSIYDSSPYNWEIKNINNVKVSAEFSPLSYRSIDFNGANSYLTIPNNENFDIINDDFTIECWIYPKKQNIEYEGIISRPYSYSSGYSMGGWRFGISITVPGHVYFGYGDGTSERLFRSSHKLKIREWQHVAVSKNANIISIYLDGYLSNTFQFTNNAGSSNSNIFIGQLPNAENTFLNAYVDGLKIIKGASKYQNKFNIPNLGFIHSQKSDPHFDNVSLLMYGNEMSGSLYFSDESRFGISRLGNGCGYFSGSNSTIFAPLSGIGSFGSGNFTLETWVKPLISSQPNNFIGLVNKASGLNSNNAWRLYISGSANNPVFEYTLNGSGNHKYVSGASLNVYEWSHIAVVRSGELITFFVNGYSGDRLNISNDIIFGNNLSLEIGRADRSSTVNNIFNGYLEDFRITNGIARYSSNFNNNLPIKYGDDINEDQYYNNVELLLHMNGLHNLEYIYDSSINNYRMTDSGVLIKLNNDIVTNGTAITNSTLDSVFGGASIRGIGGSTSFLHIPSRCEFGNIGSNDFTVEWWDEIVAWNSGYFPVLHYGNDGDYDTAKSRLGIYYSSSGLDLTISMSGNSQNFPIYLSSANIAQSGWRHNAITRRNGVVNLFINGIKHPSGYLMDYDISRGFNISTIGAGKYGPSLGSLYTMNGFIDDLRVTKNIARYIDDFSPPTEQFANF